MDEMIVTALPYYPGKKVVRDVGFIFAFDDRMSPVLFLEDCVKESQEILKKKARKLGANAVLNVTLSPDHSMKGFISGEAVILEDDF